MRIIVAVSVALALAACTPGGTTPVSGVQPSGTAVTIDVNLTLHTAASSPYGLLSGYAPAVSDVTVGTNVAFVNSDSFSHTATGIPNATSFPAGSPFSISAEQQHGTMISQSWSTGALGAGQASLPILVDAPGTYLYGCFFHYAGSMRGVLRAH